MGSIRTVTSLVAAALLLLACSKGGSGSPPNLAITSLLPPDGSTAAARTSEIAVDFSGDLDPASLAADQIVVRTASGLVAGATTAIGKRRLRFVPAAELPWGATVTATLRGGVRTLGGATMASDQAWSYRVVDAQPSTFSRPIASGSPTRRALVTAVPARDEFAVVVDADLWGASTLASSPPPVPYHEALPFVPTRKAASIDGSIMGVQLVDRGIGTPDLFLEVAKRDALGNWQNADVRVLTGSSASVFTHEGGRGGAFVTQLYSIATGTIRALVGPRATAPVLTAFDSSTTSGVTTVAALDLDTAVVCQSSTSGPATFTRHALGTNPPIAEATWQHAFGILAADADGNLLVLAADQGRLVLDRLTASGTVDASAAVEQPATMPLEIWRILPTNGAAAAIAARFGVCSSFRLDASESSPQLRSFDLDQDAIDSGAWDACYSPNGDLVVVARIRATPSSPGRLVLWRQRPGRDWESAELVAEDQNRPLGRPGIAVDPSGLLFAAAPRAVPDEVVVVQWRAPATVSAPR